MVTKARTLGSAVSIGGVIERDGAIVSYDTVDDLPLNGNTVGDTAYVSGFSRVYMWTGAGWFSIALINQNPAFDSGGTPEASYELDSAGGDPLVIQLSASDPEGLPIQWSYTASDSAQYFADITNDSSVFTITAKDTGIIEQYDSSGGTFSVTFKASDGVNLATALSEFTILFSPPKPEIDSFTNVDATFDTSNHDTTVRGVSWNDDGTKLYLCGNSEIFREYSATTPYDINTITTTGSTYTVRTNTYDFEWSPDGTKMYGPRRSATDGIHEYQASIPWDVSTLVQVGNLSSVETQNGYHCSVTLSSDGNYIYALDYQTVLIYQYYMSTPYDITTAIYDNKNFIPPVGAGATAIIRLIADTFLYILPSNTTIIYQYKLLTPKDISSAILEKTLDLNSLGLSNTGFSGMTFKPDYNKMYLTNYGTDLLYEIS